MPLFHRFDEQYDVATLERDLAAAEAVAAGHLLSNARAHDGGLSAIALVAVDGRTDSRGLERHPGPYRKTSILQACPYLESIVDSLPCAVERVRLMRLGPGRRIFSHDDGPRYSWATGAIARLHVPIITAPAVRFVIEDHNLTMAAGELWYCDVSRTHEVENASAITRVHLVIDCLINRRLRARFPAEPAWERLRNLGARAALRVKAGARARVGRVVRRPSR